MPAERIAMRQVREMLRLMTVEKLAVRDVARRTGKAPSTVRATLGRCRAAGISWPLPEGLSDGELEERLYGKGGAKPGPAQRAELDWASIHRELKRKHVTLSILWEEYIAQEPEGLRYSRFCELYRTFAAKLPVVMRQTHAAGEKLFVDYAGDAVPVIADRLTGEWRPAQIFVAVLGASSFPTPKRPGRKASRTGSQPMSALWKRSAACPGSLCRTTPRRLSSRLASTIRKSTGPITRSQSTTILAFYQQGRASRATRPRLKPAF